MAHDKYYKKFLELNSYPRELKQYEWVPHFSSIYLRKNGKQLINFSSNDYLGLANHPFVIKRAQEYLTQYGIGSSSSRLVAGNFSIYEKLEKEIARALGKPSALILGTGFQTNFSILDVLLDSTILEKEPLVFVDRFCHSSMLVSTQNRARLLRFQHNNLTHLQNLLEKYENSDRPKFILAESLYSMEGDQADLKKMGELAKKHKAFLYIDDAHGVGIYGSSGWGKAVEFADQIDIIMGTFSKALGSFGGYVACSETVRAFLVNKCKGLIYSTGLSPAILGAISAAIELLPQLENERKKVLNHATILRNFFHEHGLDYGHSTTHIVPWIIGEANETLKISELLEETGILATTIRPPSVPKGKSRIRLCLSVAHTDEDLEQLMNAIKKVIKKI